MNEPLLTSQQVAELLAISVKSVQALVNSGDLTFVAIGQGKVRPRMRFERRDVEDYIKRAKRVRPAPSYEPPAKRRRQATPEANAYRGFSETRDERRIEREERKRLRKARK